MVNAANEDARLIKLNNKFSVNLTNFSWQPGIQVIWDMPGAMILSKEPNANQGYDEVIYTEWPPLADRHIRCTIIAAACTTVKEYDYLGSTSGFFSTEKYFYFTTTKARRIGNLDGATASFQYLDVPLELVSTTSQYKVNHITSSIELTGDAMSLWNGRFLVGRDLANTQLTAADHAVYNTNAPGGVAGPKCIEIRVKAGHHLILENVVLHAAAGEMWKGIVVELGGSLTLKNVEIRDAIKAIDFEGYLQGQGIYSNFLTIEGTTEYPSGRLNIYNSIIGLKVNALLDGAQLNNITIKSDKHGFNAPFNYNTNVTNYGNNAWFLTEKAALFDINLPQISGTIITRFNALNWFIDGAVVGVETKNNDVMFNNLTVKNYLKYGVFANPVFLDYDFKVENSSFSPVSGSVQTLQKTAVDGQSVYSGITGLNSSIIAGIVGIGESLLKVQNVYFANTGSANKANKVAIYATTDTDIRLAQINNFGVGIALAEQARSLSHDIRENIFTDNIKGVAVAQRTLSNSDMKIKVFKCNQFHISSSVPSNESWYGLYNEHDALYLNGAESSGQSSFTEGGNVFPTTSTRSSTLPRDGSGNILDIQNIWTTPSNWMSIYSTSNMRYKRYFNEFVGTVSSVVDLDKNSPPQYCVQTGITPPTTLNAVNICVPFVNTVYFPYLSPRVTSQGLDKNATFSVYPNPAESFIRVSGFVVKSVTNVTGQVANVDLSAKDDKIDVSHLPPGIYLIHHDMGTSKFIKR